MRESFARGREKNSAALGGPMEILSSNYWAVTAHERASREYIIHYVMRFSIPKFLTKRIIQNEVIVYEAL